MCYTITIIDDDVCENDPNENFFVNLEYSSGIQPITVALNRATVTIDDDSEPECGESIILLVLLIYSQGLDEAI